MRPAAFAEQVKVKPTVFNSPPPLLCWFYWQTKIHMAIHCIGVTNIMIFTNRFAALTYLASSVTVVTSLLVHSRLLCGRSFEGRASGSREEDGGTWELDHSEFLAKSTFFSKDCSFKIKQYVCLYLHLYLCSGKQNYNYIYQSAAVAL